MKVLIVEDDRTQSFVLTAQLERSPKRASEVDADSEEIGGFDVRCAATLEEAIVAIEAAAPDVVLLDLSLPDSSGLDTLERIREAAPATAIVVLTGHDDEAMALEAISNGAQDYLIKGSPDADGVSRALRYAVQRNTVLHSLSLYDDMTGLHNHRGFTTLAEHQLKLAGRRKQPCLLFYLDLDGLKQINDAYSHAEGSEAICLLSEVLKETFRSSDILGRLGGDEFVALSIDANLGHAPVIVERLYETLDARAQSKARPYRLSVSIGVSEIATCCPASLENEITRADNAMYVEKHLRRHAATDPETRKRSYSIAPSMNCPHSKPKA
jgi:diguanylate cyclase (GGDEF)-like protein